MIEDVPPYRSGPGWHGTVFGSIPVQGEGEVDGFKWYFRARGSHWSIEIEDHFSSEDPKKLEPWETGAWYGVWPTAGYMPFSEAWGFIEGSIELWRSGSPGVLENLQVPPGEAT